MFKNSYSYNYLNSPCSTNEQYKKYIEKLINIIDRTDICNITKKNLIDVYEADKYMQILLLSSRINMENHLLLDDVGDDEVDFNKNQLKKENIPIKISVKNDALVVKTPYLFRRMHGKNEYTLDNFFVANMVGIEIEKWLNLNEKTDVFDWKYFRKDIRWTMILLRKSPKFSLNQICDNDNLEASRVINTICKALKLGDNANRMDLVVKYIECPNKPEDMGTYFCLMPTLTYENNPKIVYEI